MNINSKLLVLLISVTLYSSAILSKTLADYLVLGAQTNSAETNKAQTTDAQTIDAQTTDAQIHQANKENVHIRAGHARALRAIGEGKYQAEDFKTIVIKVEQLTDNQGLKYLAGLVNEADISVYLAQLQTILADKFDQFRQQQSARDHGKFHITLVNPMEYQALADKNAMIGQRVRVQLHGLGRVSQGNNTAYFVVASSSDGQFMRQNLLLTAKDFHVTLGFDAQDVYGVSKGQDSLIK